MPIKCFGSGTDNSLFNKVIYNLDGTVSGINTYTMSSSIPITAECCKTLNLTYDPIRSKCLWKAPCTINDPFTILVSPKNDDGAYFIVDNNETCTCEVEFEYLFSWDCDKMIDLAAANQTTLQQDILGTQTAISNLENAKGSISAATDTLQVEINTLTSTILSLTAQISVLESKSTLTSGEQAQLTNLKTQLTIATNAKNTATTNLANAQSEIVVFNNQISLQQTTLNNLNYQLTGTSSFNSMMSNFVAYSKLNILSASTATTITDVIVQLDSSNVNVNVFEELLINTTNNIITYLGGVTGNTGIYLSGSTNNITQVINNLKVEAKQIGVNLTDSMFKSPWIKHKLIVNETEALGLIKNQKLKIGVEIRSSNSPFSVLLDNIKLNKVCTTNKRKEIYVTESPRFNLTRVPDNKKSWVYTGNTEDRVFNLSRRQTDYQVNHSKLVINSKEIDLDIDPAKAIESNVFSYVKYNGDKTISFLDNGFYSGYAGFVFATPHGLNVGDVINIVQDAGYLNESYNGITDIIDVPNSLTIVTSKEWGVSTPPNPGTIYPFVIPKLNTNLSGVTITDKFIRIILSELIDAKNRQTISSYPTLRQLYDQYLGLASNYCSSCSLSSKFTYADIDTFTKLVGNHWVDLLEQVIPSTTIWGATNTIRNTVFDNNKFNYKRYTLQLSGSTFSGVSQSDSNTIVTTTTISDITGTTNTITGVTIGNFNEGSEFIGSVVVVSTELESGGDIAGEGITFTQIE